MKEHPPRVPGSMSWARCIITDASITWRTLWWGVTQTLSEDAYAFELGWQHCSNARQLSEHATKRH